MSPKMKKRALILFFLSVYLFFLVLKVLVTLKNADFVDLNARNAVQIQNTIRDKEDISFIAVGNVMNSVSIFREKLVPMINDSDADFIVFTGNAIIDGGNDKYAALQRTLQELNKPALFVFGDREAADRGTGNFFHHIGNPYFFFIAGNTLFLFLDTTGSTEEQVQLEWLNELLNNFERATNRIVFMNRSLFPERGRAFSNDNKYEMSPGFRKKLIGLFENTGVSAVISSSGGNYGLKQSGSIQYVATGGGGGILEPDHRETEFYYTRFRISGSNVTARKIVSDSQPTPPKIRILDYLWNKILSWVYVNFLNSILILSLVFSLVYYLNSRLIKRIDYYPDVNSFPDRGYPLTIAMFTNNYLPFIGGVPLSIVRLKKGLEEMGHKVYIFAPGYNKDFVEEQDGIIRFSPLFHYRKGDLIAPVSNIFSRRIRRDFKRINPDIVHVHHPFWLGSVGKRLAGRYHKPVVFTYHTRLEQYNHYVPVFHKLAGGQIPHLVIKYFASDCDAVIAPTSTAKRYLRNLGIGKLIVVQPTGIDLSQSAQSPPDVMKYRTEAVLFSVYRLSHEKNPYFMLEGLEKLSRKTNEPFCCFIAGTGPEEEKMQTWIGEHGMEKQIILLGKVNPDIIPGYYHGAELFIFSSQSETQGMVILEAMAGGAPVVAVDSSGISDIVENGINGYKTPEDLDAWVEKIRLLLEDRELRQRLAEQALLTAGQYSIQAMCGNILDMYYDIIDWKKKHPDKVFIR